jgi:hypothetical protein
MSEYEKLREQNIRRNQEMLRQMGLLSPSVKLDQKPPPPQETRQPQQPQKTKTTIRFIRHQFDYFLSMQSMLAIFVGQSICNRRRHNR